MLRLRRVSTVSIRVQGLRLGTAGTCGTLESASSHVKEKLTNTGCPKFTLDRWPTSMRFYCTVRIPRQFSMGSCSLSSQAGARSGGEEEDDLEDGFSELETLETSECVKDRHVNDEIEVISEPELSEDDDHGEEAPENDSISDAQIPQRKRFSSALFKAIMDDPLQSVHNALDKYMAEGADFNRSEISNAMLNLRKRRMFGKALQLSEWLETAFVHYAQRFVQGLSNDIAGMDQIVETMKADGVEADIQTQASLARHYAAGGLEF
ncbi:hypothetical protein Nepgr_030164 [Nepenthes gracilis]|uniref:Uncharacterized protein n=1 Tax=Nepenthes gracilis TaxID=150966 RepID=A0AAD3Y6A5_NEPGR|nr:hypothetical protein Nepgr_030164 [Nepenthes gracilis]